MKNTNTISTLALSAALSAGLLLGGCGKKDASDISKASEKVISKTAAKIDTKIVDIKKRKVSDAQAQQALTALFLNESESGALKWASKSGSAGNYTFKDVTIKGDDDNVISISSMELMGAHMEGEQASFDKIIFKGFSAQELEEDGKHVNVAIKSLSLSEPSPALVGAIASSFGGDEDAFDDVSGDIRFSGFSIADMKLTADDGGFNLGAMEFGKSKDKTGVFTMSNLDLDVNDKENVKMHVGSISASGINLEKYEGLISAAMSDSEDKDKAMESIMSSINPYNPDFKDFSVKDVSFNVEGLAASLKSYTGNVVKKGDTVIMTAAMSPLTIKPPAEAKGELKEFTDALSELGYSELSFTMAGTTELNEVADTMKTYNTFIEMKDGFKLSYDLDLTGYKAMLDKMKEAGAGASNNPMAAMGYMSAMKLGKAHVSFRDDSIIDRGFKLAAAQQGGTADSLRMQAKMGLAFLPMMAKDEGQQELAGQLSKALGALLEGGGTLTLDINPPGGELDLSTVMGGAMGGELDVSKLGITITHK